jgi:heat shock protein HtpX
MKWLGHFSVCVTSIYLTLSFTANLLVNMVLPAFGIDVRGVFSQQLLVWSLVIGFGGAFISLAFSKQMARAMLDCEQITQPRSQEEHVIYGSVQEIAQRLGITMPEVWVYNSPDPNAFATGPSKNNSMVAVSTGLLQNLKEGEVKAVLAHEMGHVYNGDMFTTTVLAGLMNTFVHYISNFLAWTTSTGQEEGSGGSPIRPWWSTSSCKWCFVLSAVVAGIRRQEFSAFSAKVYVADDRSAASTRVTYAVSTQRPGCLPR